MPDGSGTHRASSSANFSVSIDGVAVGTFTEVAGLAAEVSVEEIAEGGSGFVHKMPSKVTWPNLVLKRGLVQGNELLLWFEEFTENVIAGKAYSRSTITINAHRPDSSIIREWNFMGGIPVKWTGPNFQAGSNQVQVEELEIAHHGFAAQSAASSSG